jgi:hypothetical protein
MLCRRKRSTFTHVSARTTLRSRPLATQLFCLRHWPIVSQGHSVPLSYPRHTVPSRHIQVSPAEMPAASGRLSTSNSSSVPLPPELLSEIFAYCSPSPPNALSTGNTPFALSTVSRSWRASACATSTLWTNVAFTPKTMPSLPLWLERSRGLPIVIVVTLMEPLIGDNHVICLSMLLRLREHLH